MEAQTISALYLQREAGVGGPRHSASAPSLTSAGPGSSLPRIMGRTPPCQSEFLALTEGSIQFPDHNFPFHITILVMGFEFIQPGTIPVSQPLPNANEVP